MARLTLIIVTALLGLSSHAVASVLPPREEAMAFPPTSITKLSDSPSFNTTAEAKTSAMRDGVDCIDFGPEGAAHYDDCHGLCSHFRASPTSFWLPRLQILRWEHFSCAFGIANLSPCRDQTIRYSDIANWCFAMNSQCIVNGKDALFDISSLQLEAVLTGATAAPVYSPPATC